MFLGRVVEPGEPLWTAEDRDWAVALLTYEADLCPGCGHPRAESMHPGAEFDTYTAEARRCHACVAVAHSSDRYTQPGADPRGLFIGVTKTWRAHG